MQRIINTGDFIWLDVTDKAKEIFTTGLFSLYAINDSQADYLIETMDQLNKAMENGHKIAIEGGKTEHQPPAPHTPGPWFYANSGGSVIYHDGKKYKPICVLEKSPLAISPEIEANCMLISSAPQLLKVLQVTRDILTDWNQFSGKYTNLLDVISSAINLSRK